MYDPLNPIEARAARKAAVGDGTTHREVADELTRALPEKLSLISVSDDFQQFSFRRRPQISTAAGSA